MLGRESSELRKMSRARGSAIRCDVSIPDALMAHMRRTHCKQDMRSDQHVRACSYAGSCPTAVGQEVRCFRTLCTTILGSETVGSHQHPAPLQRPLMTRIVPAHYHNSLEGPSVALPLSGGAFT